jgi:hypothetical protein
MVEKTEKLENIFRAETLRRSNDGEKENKLKENKKYMEETSKTQIEHN